MTSALANWGEPQRACSQVALYPVRFPINTAPGTILLKIFKGLLT